MPNSKVSREIEDSPFPSFAERHVGPGDEQLCEMLALIGHDSLDSLIDAVVPAKIRFGGKLNLPESQSEFEVLRSFRTIAGKNRVAKSYIGLGYNACVTPPVILRNILEKPGWYTSYTPYQAEIAQGRLEALLNFQTMVTDLTGLEIANASLLDEATAAAEGMAMCFALRKEHSTRAFFVSETCHPQAIAVVKTRARPIGIEVIVGDHRTWNFAMPLFGALIQYPATEGPIYDYRSFIDRLHETHALAVVAADLLSLTLLVPPGEFGADICVGSTQRFGVPLGYGGPHAAYFATRDQFKRLMPGRLVGVSKDPAGRPGYRLSLQTREQHIRRDKATSNICTAQVLLAVIAATYAVYHGPGRLKQIAERIRQQTARLALGLDRLGFKVGSGPRFDTLRVSPGPHRNAILAKAAEALVNFRQFEDGSIGISLDETVSEADLRTLLGLFTGRESASVPGLSDHDNGSLPEKFVRKTPYLTHPVFNRYHTETELMRYLHRLEARDLSLTTSMIPLGSCTMKLNAAVEMLPLTWPELGQIHPFVPPAQAAGYRQLIDELERWLVEITGFDAISVQPNAGSQGEYAGLLAIREFHHERGGTERNVCLIPTSAHGTNPASAAMAGFQVVPVQCDAQGNIDIADLRKRAELHADRLGALMVTYPSTHGVFEEGIKEICEIVHQHGGQVYMDGANMNALVGLCRPAELGADVCHLNLHKTFCIPHGGGGPGVGPIGVKAHLAPYLPGNPLAGFAEKSGVGPVAAAPYGSASILGISWTYIRLMGPEGLTHATKIAIANANYVASRLASFFPILYRGKNGLVAHECIIDLRQFKKAAGIEVEDVAKRLMDYGFHAPTMSWPVPGTMMIEPTESESKAELDRFCDAMISIHGEIRAIETGEADREDNVLKRAPHTAQDLLADNWDRSYSRESAAYPAPWTREHKYWPVVGRIDNVYGDRNLFCSCVPVEQEELAD
ncbi:MAG TPA: aminomethyl-transferring glycine dehydrogenase [Chthoniobacterales bacterium]|nr:aminomethyl-transferring glycine dehydrogenase [Chthoniobacterales bacterium]